MHFRVNSGHDLKHDPIKAIVGPRPIGWISTLNKNGKVNLSPYSFFNLISSNPHLIGFSSHGKKDAQTLVEESGNFVCNFASWKHRDEVNQSSAPLALGVSELDAVGLHSSPSSFIEAPRVADVPAALECLWVETLPLKSVNGKTSDFHLVIGEVVGVYIDNQFVHNGLVDTGAMEPILRGGYHDFFKIVNDGKFSLQRPKDGGHNA